MSGTAFNQYLIGQPARLTATFKTQAGVLVDPSTVTFRVRKPSGALVSLVYLTDAAVIRDSQGIYHVDIATDYPGTWHYRAEGGGSNAAAAEHSLVVLASRVR